MCNKQITRSFHCNFQFCHCFCFCILSVNYPLRTELRMSFDIFSGSFFLLLLFSVREWKLHTLLKWMLLYWKMIHFSPLLCKETYISHSNTLIFYSLMHAKLMINWKIATYQTSHIHNWTETEKKKKERSPIIKCIHTMKWNEGKKNWFLPVMSLIAHDCFE